jgi:hypothetical protein
MSYVKNPELYLSYPSDRYKGTAAEQRSRAIHEVVHHLVINGYEKVIPANRFYKPRLNELVLLGTSELNPRNKVYPHDFIWRPTETTTFLVSVVMSTPHKFISSFWKTMPLAIEAGYAGMNYLQVVLSQTPLRFRDRFPHNIRILEEYYHEEGRGFCPIVTIDEFKAAQFIEMAAKGKVTI